MEKEIYIAMIALLHYFGEHPEKINIGVESEKKLIKKCKKLIKAKNNKKPA